LSSCIFRYKFGSCFTCVVLGPLAVISLYLPDISKSNTAFYESIFELRSCFADLGLDESSKVCAGVVAQIQLRSGMHGTTGEACFSTHPYVDDHHAERAAIVLQFLHDYNLDARNTWSNSDVPTEWVTRAHQAKARSAGSQIDFFWVSRSLNGHSEVGQTRLLSSDHYPLYACIALQEQQLVVRNPFRRSFKGWRVCSGADLDSFRSKALSAFRSNIKQRRAAASLSSITSSLDALMVTTSHSTLAQRNAHKHARPKELVEACAVCKQLKKQVDSVQGPVPLALLISLRQARKQERSLYLRWKRSRQLHQTHDRHAFIQPSALSCKGSSSASRDFWSFCLTRSLC